MSATTSVPLSSSPPSPHAPPAHPPSKREIERRLSLSVPAPPKMSRKKSVASSSGVPGSPTVESLPPLLSPGLSSSFQTSFMSSPPSGTPIPIQSPPAGLHPAPPSHNLLSIIEGPPRGAGVTGRTFSDSENEAGDEEEDEEDDEEEGMEEDEEMRKKVEGERILKSGYLEKKGEKRKSWKKRWFVLRTGRLSYYKDNREYKLLKLIDLREIHSTSLVQLKKHIAALGIVTQSRTFYVKASSSIDAENWVEAINAACRDLKQMDEMEHEMKTGMNMADSSTGNQRKQSRSGSSGVMAPPIPIATSSHQRSPSLSGSSLPTVGILKGPSPVLTASFLGPVVGQPTQPNGPPTPLRLNTNQPSWGDVQTPHAGSLVTSPMERQAAQSPTRMGATSSSEDEDFEEPMTPAQGSPVMAPPTVSSSSSAVNPNKVILKAYLMKMGKRKNWRKRWFVLTSGSLMYSSSHMDTKPHRIIPLIKVLDALEYEPVGSKDSGARTDKLYPTSSSNYDLAGVAESLSSSPLKAGLHTAASAVGVGSGDRAARNINHAFKIITPKKVFIVCAPSEEEEIQWLSALQALIARRVAGNQAAAVLGGKLNSPIPPVQSRSLSPTSISTALPSAGASSIAQAHIPTILEQPPSPPSSTMIYSLPSPALTTSTVGQNAGSISTYPTRTPSPSASRSAPSDLAQHHLPSIASQMSGSVVKPGSRARGSDDLDERGRSVGMTREHNDEARLSS